MPDIPKLSIPIALAGDRLAAVEQDSPAEIAQCVYAALVTELGERNELPEYGLADQAFRQGGPDLEAIRLAIEEWEERADALTDEELTGILSRVQVTL